MDPYPAALILTALANAFAICRAVFLRLQQTLPWVVLFLVYQFCQFVVIGSLPTDSRLYRQLYIISEPLVSILGIMVVREMYHRAFASYPGISSLARWSTRAAGAAAIVVCGVMVSLTPAKDLTPKVVYSYAVFWEECVLFTLAAFIFVMVFILWRYPIRLESNLAANIAIFTVFFFGTSALLAAQEPETVRNYGLLGLSSVCYMAWGLLLKRRSEISIVRLRPHLDDMQAERLLQQLGAINTMLARSARR
jgi:hypothetical protein